MCLPWMTVMSDWSYKTSLQIFSKLTYAWHYEANTLEAGPQVIASTCLQRTPWIFFFCLYEERDCCLTQRCVPYNRFSQRRPVEARENTSFGDVNQFWRRGQSFRAHLRRGIARGRNICDEQFALQYSAMVPFFFWWQFLRSAQSFFFYVGDVLVPRGRAVLPRELEHPAQLAHFPRWPPYIFPFFA